MILTVKAVFHDQGYGFIVVNNHPRDIFFHMSVCSSDTPIKRGDTVEVEAYVSAPRAHYCAHC